MEDLIEEGKDPKLNPFLKLKSGAATASFRSLKVSSYLNDRHAELIDVFMRPLRPSEIILRNILFSKHPEHFTIDGDGPGIADYIISKIYLNL